MFEGQPLEPGGIYEQPAAMLEAFSICKQELARAHEERARERDKARKEKEQAKPNTAGPRRR
jgi:hypothetical protein